MKLLFQNLSGAGSATVFSRCLCLLCFCGLAPVPALSAAPSSSKAPAPRAKGAAVSISSPRATIKPVSRAPRPVAAPASKEAGKGRAAPLRPVATPVSKETGPLEAGPKEASQRLAAPPEARFRRTGLPEAGPLRGAPPRFDPPPPQNGAPLKKGDFAVSVGKELPSQTVSNPPPPARPLAPAPTLPEKEGGATNALLPSSASEEPPEYSWIFDSRKTKQELAFLPVYYMSRTYGPNWGLRFFTFSPENAGSKKAAPLETGFRPKEGFYFSAAVINKMFSPWTKWALDYRKAASPRRELNWAGRFSRYFEPYYKQAGMETKAEEEQLLFSDRLQFRIDWIFKDPSLFFFSAGTGALLFKTLKIAPSKSFSAASASEKEETKEIENPAEFSIWLKLKAGYDSRDNWKDPGKGVFHQLSLSCLPSFGAAPGYCLSSADLRAYLPLQQLPFLKKPLLALRGFAGTSLFAPASYPFSYKLGGSEVFRGFTDNRFRGDKIYFGQSELRSLLWKKFVSGALFLELGEAAERGRPFAGFLWDWGLGLRFALPPSYDIKLRADFGFSKDKFHKRSYNFIVDFFQAF